MPAYELSFTFIVDDIIEPDQVSFIQLALAVGGVLEAAGVDGACDFHSMDLTRHRYPTEAECARYFQDSVTALRRKVED